MKTRVNVKLDQYESFLDSIIGYDLLFDLGNDLVSFYKKQMRKGLDINNDEYKPLKATYEGKPYRQKKGYKQYDAKVLIDSGKMWGGIRFQIDGNQLSIIDDMEYSSYHNYGNPDRNTPQRQFIGNSDEVDKVIKESVNISINKKLKF